MRHKASGPLADFWHRIPRAAAYRLEKAAKQVFLSGRWPPLPWRRAWGSAAYAALASVTGGPSTGPSESALDPANPEAERAAADHAGTTPARRGRGPAPGASPSGQPQTPPPTSQADAAPRALTRTRRRHRRAPRPRRLRRAPSQPSPDVAEAIERRTPPNTSLSEEFPESDSALFMLSATRPRRSTAASTVGRSRPATRRRTTRT